MSTRRSGGIGRCEATSHAPTWAITSRVPRTATWSLLCATWATPGSRLSCWSESAVAATLVVRQREPDRCLAGVPGDQLGRGPVVEHPPVAHRNDPVAQRLCLVELVRDQQHRRTGVVELGDRRPDLAPGGRVEALGELVEDHQPGPVEQRQHQEQPLPLAAAQARERGPASVRQPELLQQPVTVGRPATGEQVDRLGDPEPVRQAGALQLAADLLSQPVGVPDRVQAQAPGPHPSPGAAVPGGSRPSWSCRHRWRRSDRGPRRHGRRGRGGRRRSGRRRPW